MRNPNRIKTLLLIYERPSVRERFLTNVVKISGKADITRFMTKWREKSSLFLKYWQENPNQRMGEVLIGLKIIPPFSGTWMNTEDETFLKECGFADERTITIVTLYREDGTEEGIPLKSVSDKHLNKILKEKGDETPKFIEEEIEFRKTKKLKVVEIGNPYYELEESDEE